MEHANNMLTNLIKVASTVWIVWILDYLAMEFRYKDKTDLKRK